MLSPDEHLTPIILGVLLAALLATLMLRAVRKDRREYARFKRFRSTVRRQKMMRKWTIESFAVFGSASVVILGLAWQYVPRMLADIERWPPVAWFRKLMADGGGFASGLVWGASIALVLGSVLVIWLARNTDEVPTVGDISALLPRNRQELRWGAAMSINAGVVEELLFRLALPVLLYAVTTSALAAVVVSILIFALLHVYQGVPGVLGSMLLGGILMAIFLGSGSIIVAIIVHILIDLRSLVLIPVIIFGVQKKAGPRRRRTAGSAVARRTPPSASDEG